MNALDQYEELHASLIKQREKKRKEVRELSNEIRRVKYFISRVKQGYDPRP